MKEEKNIKYFVKKQLKNKEVNENTGNINETYEFLVGKAYEYKTIFSNWKKRICYAGYSECDPNGTWQFRYKFKTEKAARNFMENIKEAEILWMR